MAIRFPGLIPYTMNVNFQDFSERIYKYCDLYRLSKHTRVFKGLLNNNGLISIKGQLVPAPFQKSNHTDEVKKVIPKVKEVKPISNRMKTLRGSLVDLVSRK